MHPVKVSVYDLKAMTHETSSLGVFPLERAELTPHGLHYLRPMPGHERSSSQEVHALPALDLVVTYFGRHPGQPPHSRYYLDMATIDTGAEDDGAERWTVRDLYLDVIMQTNGVPILWDADEYTEAVLEGHLTPDEQTRALLSAARVVNGLFSHANDLEAWLASLGVHLEWWNARDSTLPR